MTASVRRSEHRRLPSEPASVREARRFVEQFLAEEHINDLDAAVLVVSELMTNAVVHGGDARPIDLTLKRDSAGVSIEVEDGDPHPPIPGAPQSDQDRGRGMIIVDRMAYRWGWAPLQDGGKRVWCEVHG
jgi:anti-sigma regulatory factor (Ser/Thr protein kinase)